MLEDFLIRALLGGIGVALAAGPLGCFVVWRRMAYFGDALAHAALLGIALGFLLSIDLALGVLIVCGLFAIAIVLLQEQSRFATDTLLGILSHSALALGLVALGFLAAFRVDLMGYLFGDILAIGIGEVAAIWLGGAAVLAGLALIWRPLLAVTIHAELARAEGAPAFAIRLAFTLLLAVTIAIAMRVVGVLLITALLIIPAAAARPLAQTPEVMAALAAGFGAAAVAGGLWLSLEADTPSGPSIVVAALALFLLAQIAAALRPAREA